MAPTAPSSSAIRVADLPQTGSLPFDLKPSKAAINQISRDLDLLDLRKLRFTGQIQPSGKADWQLTGRLGATVVQPCVATLEPVTTRIETEVSRLYLADFEFPEDAEAEMPEDDTAEALGAFIDPADVMTEALSLSLPLYPRAKGVEEVKLGITEPGKEVMTDEEAKPFAGLADLKAKLEDKDN